MTSQDALTFEVDDGRIDLALRLAPLTVYFWMRWWFGQVAEIHRSSWRRQMARSRMRWLLDFTGAKQDGSRTQPTRVGDINERVTDPDGDFVRYEVHPEAKRTTDERDAERLEVDIWSPSQWLAEFNKPTVVRARRGRKLALPVTRSSGRRGRLWPSQFRDRNPRAVLITLTSKSGSLILAERKRRRTGERRRPELTPTGRVRKRQRKTWQDELIARWVLVDQVRKPRTDLMFYDVWRQLRGVRDRMFEFATRKIEGDIDRGVLT